MMALWVGFVVPTGSLIPPTTTVIETGAAAT